jgi:hypothetical protein
LVAAAGALAAPVPLTPEVASALDRAVETVPTEASAMALRACRGETGRTTIRGGRRTVELTPQAAGTFYFDPEAAMRSAAPLAAAVIGAEDLDEANEILNRLGVRTELDWEREMAAGSSV